MALEHDLSRSSRQRPANRRALLAGGATAVVVGGFVAMPGLVEAFPRDLLLMIIGLSPTAVGFALSTPGDRAATTTRIGAAVAAAIALVVGVRAFVVAEDLAGWEYGALALLVPVTFAALLAPLFLATAALTIWGSRGKFRPNGLS